MTDTEKDKEFRELLLIYRAELLGLYDQLMSSASAPDAGLLREADRKRELFGQAFEAYVVERVRGLETPMAYLCCKGDPSVAAHAVECMGLCDVCGKRPPVQYGMCSECTPF